MLTMEALRRRSGGGDLARVSSEGGGVCVRTHEEVLVCVCVWRGRGVFEEMTRVLKILLRGSQTRE